MLITSDNLHLVKNFHLSCLLFCLKIADNIKGPFEWHGLRVDESQLIWHIYPASSYLDHVYKNVFTEKGNILAITPFV